MPSHRIGVDAAGFIQKHVSPAFIQAPYTNVVSLIGEYLRSNCAAYLHSGYLAGSIPAGTAIPGYSDIDITLVYHGESPMQLQADSAELRRILLQTFAFLPKVDIVTGAYTEVLDSEHRYGWGFWFQHCCACIYGEDIGRQIAPFRPSWELMYGLNGDIGQYNQRIKRELGACSDVDTGVALCYRIARKYIRTAFGLVAVPEASYTDDLKLAVSLFLRHYPVHEATLRFLLEQAREPTAATAEMTRIVETFGVWLEAQYTALPR